MVERRHPLGVAPGEVVVDRHDVDAAFEQGVRVHRERRDQRLSLAGLHLGHLALVQDVSAHDLHVEVTHAEGALSRLATDRERLGQHVVERLAGGEASPELRRLGLQFGVREGRHRRFEGVRLRDRAA
jgi:hypothetical protein